MGTKACIGTSSTMEIQMAAMGKPKRGRPTPPWSPGPTIQHPLNVYLPFDWFATPTPPLFFHFYYFCLLFALLDKIKQK